MNGNNVSFNLILSREENSAFIKCTIHGWDKSIYTIPRNQLAPNKDNPIFKCGGIYFLLGPETIGFEPNDNLKESYKISIVKHIYVGKASLRKNNNGILYRILEPHETEKNWYDCWNTAIVIVPNDDKENPIEDNELSYLENKFWKVGTDIGEYQFWNAGEPSCSRVSQYNEYNFNEDFDKAKLVLNIFGCTAFENTDNFLDGECIQQEIVFQPQKQQNETRNPIASRTVKPNKTNHREPFSFEKCGIAVGEEINFKDNPEIVAIVMPKNQIKYQGELTSTSKAAKEIKGVNYDICGTTRWLYKGRVLDDIRKEREKLGLYKSGDD